MVPALPRECNTPCSGNGEGETATCGSSYRLSAYGPSFYHIEANHVVFQHATVHKWFQVNIDLKLADNTANPNKANVYGLMTEGSTYPNIGSMIPAIFIEPNSNMLEVCLFLDGSENCRLFDDAYTPDEWFNLTVERYCWIENCYVIVWLNNTIQFWWNVATPETFYDVEGVIGNTYKQVFVAATGLYKNFNLDQSEDGSGITWLAADEPDSGAAVNA